MVNRSASADRRHLSAALENAAEPAGNDIRHDLAGYLVRSGGGIVRAVEVHEHSVGRAPHPRGAPVEDMGVNHRGADVPVTQQLLDGADVVAVLQQVGSNIRDRHQAPQVPQTDTLDGLDWTRAGLWPAATGADNRRPSRLTSDHYLEAELERNPSGVSD